MLEGNIGSETEEVNEEEGEILEESVETMEEALVSLHATCSNPKLQTMRGFNS
jgi:hypothetical protein